MKSKVHANNMGVLLGKLGLLEDHLSYAALAAMVGVDNPIKKDMVGRTLSFEEAYYQLSVVSLRVEFRLKWTPGETVLGFSSILSQSVNL